MAGPTRFELATSGVTGQRSNQLNYDPAVVRARQACRPVILLDSADGCCTRRAGMVGGTGFEPVTPGV